MGGGVGSGSGGACSSEEKFTLYDSPALVKLTYKLACTVSLRSAPTGAWGGGAYNIVKLTLLGPTQDSTCVQEEESRERENNIHCLTAVLLRGLV